jgi:peptide/nickel transport system substrate-binding protein
MSLLSDGTGSSFSMSLVKRTRFLYWFIKELGKLYKRHIVFGLVIGSITFIAIQNFILPFYRTRAKKTEYIGIVGDYTVSTLPEPILNQISYGLTQQDEFGNISPGLAASWEATDSGKKYLFQINTNIVWHDKTKVTLNDINYNIKDVTVTRKEPDTIIYQLPMPYSPFLTVVSKPIFKKGLIGYGPYFVSGLLYKGGYFLTLTLSSHDERIASKTYKFYKTEGQAILAYKQGEVDRLEGLLSYEKEISTWKNTIVSNDVNYNRMVMIFFNMKDPLLQEKSLRQALAYSVPELSEERVFSPIGKTSWAYADSVKQYTYDVQQAQKLFENTKISTSSASLTLYTFSPYLDTAKKIAESWTTLGIPTEVKVENMLPPSYQVFLTARDIPKDPDQYAFWHSTQTLSNITNYSNPKIDKLLEDGRAETDQEKRLEIYIDFQKRLVDDAPAIFLYYPKTYRIERK